jgi:D-alanyl-D-alanine carboxypeptidase
MKSRKFNRKMNDKKKWTIPLMTTLGLILLLTPLTWLGLHNWSMEESLVELGFAKVVTDGTPEDPDVPENITPPTLPEDKENPIEEQPEQPEKQDQPEQQEQPETPVENIEEPGEPVETPLTNTYDPNKVLPTTPTFIEGILVANKHYPLPSTYAPGESKEARDAFNNMAAAAKLDGFDIVAFSTYRSFEYQTTLYNRYVEKDGQEAADRYSARPGYSEHQTGLAFDIGEKNFEQYWASEAFGGTPSGEWVATHAHEYGFILRYPIGKEEVTGYMHESWHFRYVGVGPAKDMYSINKTLEEYLEL